jgi:hypothetical protein
LEAAGADLIQFVYPEHASGHLAEIGWVQPALRQPEQRARDTAGLCRRGGEGFRQLPDKLRIAGLGDIRIQPIVGSLNELGNRSRRE